MSSEVSFRKIDAKVYKKLLISSLFHEYFLHKVKVFDFFTVFTTIKIC